jgi:hypothetical protein
MNTKKQFLNYTIFPLIIGVGIYLAFRPRTLILNSWLQNFNIQPIKVESQVLAQFFFSLPFSLWAIAFINTILVIWQNQINRKSIYWFILSLIISPMTEIFQLFKFVPGTFDNYDLLFLVVAICAFIFGIKPKLNFYL